MKLFETNGNRLTLGEIMQTSLAAEYRARMTELRGAGWSITCERRRPASMNLYTLKKVLAEQSAI